MESMFAQPWVILINLVAVGIMGWCLYLTSELRAKVRGGLIKKKVDFLFYLVAFFTGGYLVPPFLALVPETLRPFLVAAFSIFGAIYVLISVKLMIDVIKALSE